MLIASVGTRWCALPLDCVVETMRPLPIQPVSGAPAFVAGVCVVRGVPIPVLDLRALMEGGSCSGGYGRLVTIKVANRRAALGVDGVVGVRSIGTGNLVALPAILEDAASSAITSLGVLDAQLLVVLQAARLVPEGSWSTTAPPEALS